MPEGFHEIKPEELMIASVPKVVEQSAEMAKSVTHIVPPAHDDQATQDSSAASEPLHLGRLESPETEPEPIRAGPSSAPASHSGFDDLGEFIDQAVAEAEAEHYEEAEEDGDFQERRKDFYSGSSKLLGQRASHHTDCRPYDFILQRPPRGRLGRRSSGWRAAK
jgi:hypothetical protein